MKAWDICKSINENRVFSDSEGHKWRVVYKDIINEYVLIDDNNHILVCNSNISNMDFTEDISMNLEYQRILVQYECLELSVGMLINENFDIESLLDIYSDCKILFNECNDKEYHSVANKLTEVMKTIKDYYNIKIINVDIS